MGSKLQTFTIPETEIMVNTVSAIPNSKIPGAVKEITRSKIGKGGKKRENPYAF
jgi:hypothetical protein